MDYFDFSGLTKANNEPVNDLADFATLLDDEFPPIVSVFSDVGRDTRAFDTLSALSKQPALDDQTHY